MIKEDYVSFEIAKLLKEKGFDIACEYQYINCSSGHPFLIDMRDDAGNYYKNSEIGNDEYSAPTLAMVMKWLRDEKNIFIDVYYDCDFGEGYRFSVHKLPKGTTLETHNENYSIYETACEAAIKYCLENLI